MPPENDMDEDVLEDSEDALLYDVLVHKEWPFQPEIESQQPAADQTSSNCDNGWKDWFTSWFFWPGGSKVRPSLPSKVSSLLNSRSLWKIAISNDGSLVSILEDTTIEIFQKENFLSPLAKIRLSKDALPAYRLMCWSPDSSLLALTSSNGHIDLYDCNGFHVYEIFSQTMLSQSAQHPEPKCYAGIFFSTTRVKSRDWVIELILVDYQGDIISFLLSPSGYQDYTRFSIPEIGVLTSAMLCHDHGLLCIAGQGNSSEISGPSKYGLSMWRLLGEPPYYDWVPPYDQNVPTMNQRFHLSGYLYGNSKHQDHIYLMELSPNGRELCCVHTSGDISVWQVPSLRPSVYVPLPDQPSFDELNPTLLQNPRLKRKKKQFLRHPLKWMPLCVKWWDDKSIALVRFSGGVSILSTDSQRNILGDSPEFFVGATTFTQPFNSGFFILECEKTSGKKLDTSESFNDGDLTDGPSYNDISSEDDDEDEEQLSTTQRGKKLAKQIAFSLTESERFAPPRKKPRLMMTGYKLLSLTSTTPKELFARKIELEEYGEALILAQHYQLDSDQVYMRQWKNSNLGETAISDYLFKVKKRTLVLNECLTTVPPEPEAVRCLLEYGLQETDCDVISSDGDDRARFISEKTFESNPSYLSDEEISLVARQREDELLSKVNWSSLDIFQKDILIQRRLLLKYLDRLDGYLSLLEEEETFCRKNCERQQFEPRFYIKFRSQPILKSAIEFARQGKIASVSSLIDNYPSQLNCHVLGILGNIPESISPDIYSHLIPLKDLPEQNRVEKKRDWSDFPFIRKSIESDPFTEAEEEIVKIVKRLPSAFVLDKRISKKLLSSWCNYRARIIYDRTGLVDNSLQLLHWAEVNEIEIDLYLQHLFLTLDSMAFTLQQPGTMKISSLEKMSHLEVVLKLMADATTKNFMDLFLKILIPFSERIEMINPCSRTVVLKDYILHLATSSLGLPATFLKAVLNETSTSIAFLSNDDCVELGIQCIYGYEGEEDQINIITDLATFLRSKSQSPNLREDLSEILDVTRSIKLIKKYNISKSLQFFTSSKSNEKCMKDLCSQIARRAEGKKPRLNAQEWSGVLEDLFEYRRLCPLIVTEWFCIETLCNSLLCSESKENIKMVQDIFSHSMADVLFKTSNKSSSMLYILSMYKVGSVPKDAQKKIVLDACKFYFDSCRDVSDHNLEYVREILKLLPPELRSDKDVEPTTNFLAALDMLREFGVSILPIVLRSAESQVNVVQKILSSNKQAYKNVRKILKLIRLLGSCVDDESSILSVVADFAIKAEDFDACLTICDILITTHPTSDAASRIASLLIQQDKFEDMEAKGRLSSFCVAFCSDEMIESMITMRREIFCTHMQEEQQDVVEHEFKFEDIAAQPVALVKAAAETTTRVLPESGTRAISSLWGKISQFKPVLQSVTGDMKNETGEISSMKQVVDEVVNSSTSLKKFHPQLAVDPFYETCFQGGKIGRLVVSFDGYSARNNDASVDETTLKLIRRHYESSLIPNQLDDEIDWTILKDIIINILVNEDFVVGISLLITEFTHRDLSCIQDVFQDSRLQHFILPVASIVAMLNEMKEQIFQIPLGQLFSMARSMHLQKKLNSQIFSHALSLTDVEDILETKE